MARVTVEDCILNIPNRFELVCTAAQRAKQIASGTPLTIDRDNDKDAVVSLREIADKTIDLEATREEIVQSFQKRHAFDPHDRIDEDLTPAQLTGLAAQTSAAFEDAKKLVAAEDYEQEMVDGMSFADENVDAED